MSERKGPWPSAEAAVATILMKDSFAIQRLHYAARMTAALAVLVVMAAAFAWSVVSRPPQFRYIMTTLGGEVMTLVPTDKPNHDDEFVSKWTVDAVTRLYSFDHVHYRQQLQDAKANLTPVGWKSFQKTLQDSGNFRAILEYRYATTAVPTGPARVTKSAIHPELGRHAWRVEFPMLITYQSSLKGTDGRPLMATQALRMSVVVIRQPEFLQPDGLGIRSILAEGG